MENQAEEKAPYLRILRYTRPGGFRSEPILIAYEEKEKAEAYTMLYRIMARNGAFSNFTDGRSHKLDADFNEAWSAHEAAPNDAELSKACNLAAAACGCMQVCRKLYNNGAPSPLAIVEMLSLLRTIKPNRKDNKLPPTYFTDEAAYSALGVGRITGEIW